jgi:hypothetical protein
VVSHDRFFVSEIANKIWWIEDEKIKEYPGTFAEFEFWKAKRDEEWKKNPPIKVIDKKEIKPEPTAAAGNNTTQIATTAFVKTAVDTVGTTQQTYTDNKFNTVVGLAKAWVIFDGSTSTILSSSNVSSVTSNGSGQYTINITNGTFSTANYIAFGLCGGGGTTGGRFCTFVNASSTSLVVFTLAPAFGGGTTAGVNNGVVRIAMFN